MSEPCVRHVTQTATWAKENHLRVIVGVRALGTRHYGLIRKDQV